MKNFTFSSPVQIHFGFGISKEIGTLAKSFLGSETPMPKRGAFVIIDASIKDHAWLKDILQSIDEAGLQSNIFDRIEPNPKDKDVYAAAEELRASGAEIVIGIGGGSTIDTAKTAALIAKFGGKVRDYAGWGKVPGPVLPIIAIPTTAGTGSETTSWAVITDTTSHEKLAIGDRYLTPNAALVDPMLTISLPVSLTAATGMDALTHAIEAYICALSNPVNDLLALEAIRLVAANLRQAVAKGDDLEARASMMLASTLGGIVINNADVAGVHCLSEAMGSFYDAPHGLLNAILLPYFMAFWQDCCGERFAQIAQAFSAAPKPEEAVTQVIALNQWLKIPRLADVGVKQQDIPQLAATAAVNVSNSSNPIPMTPSDYTEILEQAMAGELSQG